MVSLSFAGLITICGPRSRLAGGDGKAGFMKRILSLLIVLVFLLFLGVLILLAVRGRNGVADGTVVDGQEQVASLDEEQTENDFEEEKASVAETAVPAGRKPRETDKPGAQSDDEPASAGETASAGENDEQTSSASAGTGGQTASAGENGTPSDTGADNASSASAGAASGSAGDSSSGMNNPVTGSSPGANSVAGQVNSRQGQNRLGFWGGATSGFGVIRGLPDAADIEPGSYQYFEYQVIAVTKKVLAEAAEYMKLPKDSEPTDELLPAIYHVGGYRVTGFSAGYASFLAPVELRMSRSEYYPEFYIMPKSAEDESAFEDGELPPPDMDDEDDDGADEGEADEDDEESAEDDEYEDEEDAYNNTASYNNLATIFPFFSDPTVYGNEFFLDLRPPRIFAMESNMKKLSGFNNTDYGDWGRGQSPIFDDNSFSSALASTNGKPMIVAKALSGSTWILHVFFTQPLPAPEKTTPAPGSENKLVRLDFQIVRAKWNEICTAGNSDGSPAVPSDEFLTKLFKSSQLRDFYSPTFRLIPSQEPVSIQLNAKTQFVPLKWVPAQEPGIPAVPLDTGAVWTGTSLQAAARVLSDEKTVLLDYRFEKTNQTGWRNYQYSFYGFPEDKLDAGPMDRYARPQQWEPEPDVLSGMVRLPMLDTTAFRQTLFLEVGKPVLAARISNPAYQPDTLTLLFVTATVEEAEPPLR